MSVGKWYRMPGNSVGGGTIHCNGGYLAVQLLPVSAANQPEKPAKGFVY